jgi:hypothetical protein
MATVTLTFEVSSPAGLVQALKNFLGNIADDSTMPTIPDDMFVGSPVEAPVPVEPPKRGRRPRAVSSTTPVAPAEPPVAEDDWADDEPAKEEAILEAAPVPTEDQLVAAANSAVVAVGASGAARVKAFVAGNFQKEDGSPGTLKGVKDSQKAALLAGLQRIAAGQIVLPA